MEDLCEAGAPFGLKPEAIIPAYGMAETTVAVSFSECGGGMIVDEVDADLLAVLHRAVPATRGRTRRLVSLGQPLEGIEVRVVDEDGSILAPRGVGVIEVRGEPVTQGYTTVAGFIPAQDERGWYDTGDLGYLTETGEHRGVRPGQGRHHHGRPQHLPDRHRARRLPRRRACGQAVRWRCGWTPGRRGRRSPSRSSPRNYQDLDEVRRIEHQVAHEVFAEVDVRPRNVAVLQPGMIPKTPSGKLRRAHALALVN